MVVRVVEVVVTVVVRVVEAVKVVEVVVTVVVRVVEAVKVTKIFLLIIDNEDATEERK